MRTLVSARTSPMAWDLRCEVHEKLIAFLQAEYPEALPRRRVAFERLRLHVERDHEAPELAPRH